MKRLTDMVSGKLGGFQENDIEAFSSERRGRVAP